GGANLTRFVGAMLSQLDLARDQAADGSTAPKEPAARARNDGGGTRPLVGDITQKVKIGETATQPSSSSGEGRALEKMIDAYREQNRLSNGLTNRLLDLLQGVRNSNPDNVITGLSSNGSGILHIGSNLSPSRVSDAQLQQGSISKIELDDESADNLDSPRFETLKASARIQTDDAQKQINVSAKPQADRANQLQQGSNNPLELDSANNRRGVSVGSLIRSSIAPLEASYEQVKVTLPKNVNAIPDTKPDLVGATRELTGSLSGLLANVLTGAQTNGSLNRNGNVRSDAQVDGGPSQTNASTSTLRPDGQPNGPGPGANTLRLDSLDELLALAVPAGALANGSLNRNGNVRSDVQVDGNPSHTNARALNSEFERNDANNERRASASPDTTPDLVGATRELTDSLSGLLANVLTGAQTNGNLNRNGNVRSDAQVDGGPSQTNASTSTLRPDVQPNGADPDANTLRLDSLDELPALANVPTGAQANGNLNRNDNAGNDPLAKVLGLKPQLMPERALRHFYRDPDVLSEHEASFFKQIASGIQGNSAEALELKRYIASGRNPSKLPDNFSNDDERAFAIYGRAKTESLAFGNRLERLFAEYGRISSKPSNGAKDANGEKKAIGDFTRAEYIENNPVTLRSK
ncbi:hypothetical protein, partial [Pseudomonas sp. FW126-L8]